jgi:hypothetical protein
MEEKFVEIDPDAALKAFETLRPTLDALTELRVANTDLRKAVNCAAAVGRLVRQPEVRAEFEALPERHFDQKLLDLLEPAAQATWYSYVFLQDATALHSAAKLPDDLLAEATTVKQRMMRVLEYNLDDQPDAIAKLDAIRPGTSHIDTADDLMRLATMYVQYATLLAADTKHYKAEDATNAKRLAHAINRILGDGRDSDVYYWADYQARAWTLLVTTYEEVATIGRWLFRRDNGEARFPSLYAVGRQRRRNRDGGSELPGEGDELPGEGDGLPGEGEIEQPGTPAA